MVQRDILLLLDSILVLRADIGVEHLLRLLLLRRLDQELTLHRVFLGGVQLLLVLFHRRVHHMLRLVILDDDFLRWLASRQHDALRLKLLLLLLLFVRGLLDQSEA